MSNVLGHVSFGEAFRFWLKLGFISFGGPAGQIAIMHRELVDKRRWISDERFLHALNYIHRQTPLTRTTTASGGAGHRLQYEGRAFGEAKEILEGRSIVGECRLESGKLTWSLLI